MIGKTVDIVLRAPLELTANVNIKYLEEQGYVFTKQPNLNFVKLREFADNKMNLTHKPKFVFRRVENYDKGKNAGYQRFLL